MQSHLPPTTESRRTQTIATGQNADVTDRNQHIRELQTQLRSVREDNQLLRAQVDESEYWIYNRGPIAQELHELRASTADQAMEITRLTRENVRLMDDLRRAEGIVIGAGRRHPAQVPYHRY